MYHGFKTVQPFWFQLFFFWAILPRLLNPTCPHFPHWAHGPPRCEKGMLPTVRCNKRPGEVCCGFLGVGQAGSGFPCASENNMCSMCLDLGNLWDCLDSTNSKPHFGVDGFCRYRYSSFIWDILIYTPYILLDIYPIHIIGYIPHTYYWMFAFWACRFRMAQVSIN